MARIDEVMGREMGKRMTGTDRRFGEDGSMSGLELIDSVTTTKGVVIATYRPG